MPCHFRPKQLKHCQYHVGICFLSYNKVLENILFVCCYKDKNHSSYPKAEIYKTISDFVSACPSLHTLMGTCHSQDIPAKWEMLSNKKQVGNQQKGHLQGVTYVLVRLSETVQSLAIISQKFYFLLISRFLSKLFMDNEICFMRNPF